MISSKKLSFWLEKRLNVLFEGKHGVGKTAIVLEAFKNAGLRYAYFSGATCDPFIDFVGIPIKVDAPNGSYINLIRPKNLATGDIQAIFIDEFNRTARKMRNAVMELIQFKTINGEPLSGDLRVVWAAINPDSEDGTGIYDTDRLDPAQRDRFHVHIKLPYECDYGYFAKTYGENNAKAAIQFWNDLSPEEKDKVSPRRLDYAVKVYLEGGDVRDVLPLSAAPGRLSAILVAGPSENKLNELMKDNKIEDAREFLANENNYLYSIKTILSKKTFMDFFVPLLPHEKISVLYVENVMVRKYLIENVRTNGKDSPYARVLIDIATAGQHKSISSALKTELEAIGILTGVPQYAMFYIKGTKDLAELSAYDTALDALLKRELYQTHHKKAAYNQFEKLIVENMNDLMAIKVLNIATKFANCYGTTISKYMPHLGHIINYAVAVLLKSGKSIKEVEKIFNGFYRLKKLQRKNICAPVSDIAAFLGMYTPGDPLEINTPVGAGKTTP